MADALPGASLPEARKVTETTPSGAKPIVNKFREDVHGYYFPEAENRYHDGVLIPSHFFTPLDVNTDPMTHTMPCVPYTSSGTVVSMGAISAPPVPSAAAITTRSGILLYRPSGTLEAMRTPEIFKSASANAIGSTALWDPAAGKRFRIMGYVVILPSTATSAAGTTLTLMDDATVVFTLHVIGTTTTGVAYSVTLPGNGYLSAATDNILNINCSAALTVGVITVNVWGTEE
jgi:hypothetical protein